MSKPDIEIALKSLQEITVKLKFLYESKDARSILNTTQDLFGEHTQHIVLPASPHYLHFEVMGVNYGGRKHPQELTIFQLKYLLDTFKNQVTMTCYDKGSPRLIFAYLKRIELLNDTVIRYQKISIVTENNDILQKAGYHPEHIDYKEKEYGEALSHEIFITLIEPFQLWLKGLIESVNNIKSLRSTKKALNEFTKINPLDNEKINSRINASFTLNKALNIGNLRRLYNALISSGFIDNSTSIEHFNLAFIGAPISVKIEWTTYIGDLIWFKNELGSKNIINRLGAINETTALIFSKGDLDILSKLRGGKENKDSMKRILIKEALNELRASAKLL